MALIKKVRRRIRERIIIHLGVRHIAGPENIRLGPEEVVVLCLCRDEEYLLPEFLNYYRGLGAKHFVFLDNGSVDRTRDIVADQKDCTLLFTDLPYKTYKVDMKRYLIHRFSRDQWSILVDADEFFDYPYSDTISLNSLVSYLDRHGYTAVYTPLLDLFSSRTVGELQELEKVSFNRKDYPYYDLPDLLDKLPEQDTHRKSQVTNRAIRLFTGGVRNRVFGTQNTITKHGLTRCSGGKVLMHNDHAVRKAVIADFSGVLLHYKFSGSFLKKTIKHVEEGSHWNDSIRPKIYMSKVQEESDLSFMGEHTLKLVNTDELVEKSFMFMSQQYIEEMLQSRPYGPIVELPS